MSLSFIMQNKVFLRDFGVKVIHQGKFGNQPAFGLVGNTFKITLPEPIQKIHWSSAPNRQEAMKLDRN